MPQTILIVDDEPQILRLLVRVFEREGFRVLSAADGAEAVALFEAHADEIDLMVLDVIIPPGGAGEVLDAVLPRRPDLQLVLVSGDQLAPELRERIAERDAVFVRKPFVPRVLAQTVREMSSPSAEGEG